MSDSTTVATGQPGSNVLSLLPPRVRRAIYVVYGLLSLTGTALTAWFGAVPGVTTPYWLMGGLAVLGALAAPISVLAAVNVKSANPGAEV
jgi:TRAP-type C4-dicarboxylate transport system permease small subunit